MASVAYPEGLDEILNGNVDLINDTIKVHLVDTGTYTYSAAHNFEDDVSGDVSTLTLSGKSVTAGVFDAADATFTAVTGASCEALIVWKDTGTPATSALLFYIDGLSVTPNGGDIDVTWNASGIAVFA